jgi:hypothetical protein
MPADPALRPWRRFLRLSVRWMIVPRNAHGLDLVGSAGQAGLRSECGLRLLTYVSSVANPRSAITTMLVVALIIETLATMGLALATIDFIVYLARDVFGMPAVAIGLSKTF